ncbi:intradiol ring-cleavage dioxygenase [Microbacterium sp. SORGH_AS_0862]|uniref:intradiol ring-cleavage dioxygenase n=1 Tax=Microbacterium sp. SORGH_AS_0862 TaxID=3041789 RepID=UPI00278DF6E8|nr:intradiol ring-cleavage dioxygenase [Microbacterium sp. SORGH_AS_0862]MDQ1205604.1 protocatechuate 3,4-dioxygenase beta subunit [Microbacterium sp. SORGH_AS_0862]
MVRIPDAEQTPRGPAFEGRLLDRPDEEVVDQGAPFDVRTLITRRGILGLVGVGLGTAALAACAPMSSAGTTSTATPTSSASAAPGSASGTLPSGEISDETAGPYPGDGSNGPDVLEQSGIVRSDLRTSIGSSTAVEGVPLTFTLRVTDMANGDAPFAGVAVYAWHCDALGRYSMYSEGVENETWLRGVQVSDANGQVTFTSVVPGCYTGRWPHIHFEVYPSADGITDSGNAIATSQLALPEAPLTDVYALSAYDGSARNLSQVTLSSDNIFGDDGGALQVATVTGDTTSGYTAALAVRVDTTTTPSAGQAPGGRR